MLKKIAVIIFLLPGSAAARQSLLWIPADGQTAGETVTALENDRNLKLTAAFTELPKGLEARIGALERDGRLELALRPQGDPPLPLLYYPSSESVKWEGKPSTASLSSDPYFLNLRLVMEKETVLKTLKKIPAGLVSPPGGLAADYFPLARALGVKWLACGPLASTAAAVPESGGIYAVPFVAFSTSPAPGAEPAFMVFDETSAADPEAMRAGLLAKLKAAAPGTLMTVSEALKVSASTQASPSDIALLASPWSGDYTPWARSAAQAGALAAFARTRADLMLSLNDRQNDYKAAKPAFEEYFSAEDGAKLLALADMNSDQGRDAEIEIRSALGNSYRLMQKTPPSWIFSSLTDAASGTETENKIKVIRSTSGFEMQNVARKPEIPSTAPRLSPSADPYKVWKLSSFSVESDTDAVIFRFSPSEIDNFKREASGFSHVRLDLYIDINHRPSAGMTSLLAGRPLRLFPDNAWEYALEVTPVSATLYQATPKGPEAAGSFRPKTENGAIVVAVPRQALRGNPALWSYAALILAPGAGENLFITDYIADAINNGYIYAVRPDGR